MKQSNLIISISFFIIICVLLSCKTNLSELNINPNEPTYTEPGLLFKYSLKEGAGNYNTDVNVEQWGLMNWVMFTASKNGIIPGEEYVIPGNKDGFWNEQYVNALINTQEALNLLADSAQYVNQIAVGNIWKVFLFQRLTDLWGEIPYTEALRAYNELLFMPAYDTQEDIYYSMLLSLKEAAENINESEDFYSQDIDLIYQGDILKWKAFANSLRLRLAVRIKYVDPQKYHTVLESLQNNSLFENNSSSALFPFNSEKKNHLYEAYYSGQATVQNNPSKYLTDMLINTNDPRISIFLEKAPLSELFPWYDDYKGVPNLLPSNSPEWDNFEDDWGDISSIGNWFLRNETPGVFMSYSELCFLKAEAALDGYFSGNAQQYYEEGIEANIKFYGEYGNTEHIISQNDIDSYISGIEQVSLRSIITQKWLSFTFENGFEAFSEFRRTGFPEFTDFYNAPIDLSIYPKRLPYPNSEITLNNINYLKALERQGPDNEYTTIWWQTNSK